MSTHSRERLVRDRPQPIRFASVQDAAVWAGVSQETIRRRIKAGTLTGYRFGRRWRVDLDELAAAMRAEGQ